MMAVMGMSDRRIKRKMKFPERGTLRVTAVADAKPPRIQITGVITAPGVQAAAVEHTTDERNRWAGVEEVAVLVDRSDPTRFLVLWDEPVASSRYEPPWPLSARMSAWLEESFAQSYGPGDEAEVQALREAILETFAEEGPNAVTQQGWRVFEPVEEASGGAFPQVSWPDHPSAPD